MKSNKNGFSLAELLIAMGIISVIATLGFSIAKRGIDDAYDLYIYTGYKGIVGAISHAEARNIPIIESEDEEGNKIGGLEKFSNDVAATLGGSLNAPNGVSYTIEPNQNGEEDPPTQYLITMSVPSGKKGKGKATICLHYLPNEDLGVLIPMDIIGKTSCTSSIKGIEDRKDLLPFFVDNGYVGRRIPPTFKYKPRIIISARQAICSVFGGVSVKGQDPNKPYCSGTKASAPGDSPVSGKIHLTHPRKAG